MDTHEVYPPSPDSKDKRIEELTLALMQARDSLGLIHRAAQRGDNDETLIASEVEFYRTTRVIGDGVILEDCYWKAVEKGLAFCYLGR